jgi:hypothetical protein
MKNLQTFSEFLNESNKFRGKEVLPDWLGQRDFGNPVKSVKELKVGSEYIIYEPGMDNWQGEYVFQGHTGGKYIFNTNTQFGDGDPMEFTQDEIEEYINDTQIYNQK